MTKGDGTVAGLRMTDNEDSGKIDIGGNFANIADSSHTLQPRPAFARLNSNGSLDTSFGPTGGSAPHVQLFNGEVRCSTGLPDGRIVLGGLFTQLVDGSIPRGRIAAFTPNSLLDNPFAGAGADLPIYGMGAQGDKQGNGKLVIGGNFSMYNNTLRLEIARIMASSVSLNPATQLLLLLGD